MRNLPCDMGDDRRHGGMIIEPHNITNDEVERESENLKETFWCQSAVRLSRSSHQV